MTTDPVCGMAVERERAVRVERGGERFWFCSRCCRDEFLVAAHPQLDDENERGPAAATSP